MAKQLILNEDLMLSFAGKTLYELLGVNIDSSFSEINENYWVLQHLIDEYPGNLSVLKEKNCRNHYKMVIFLSNFAFFY